MPKRLGPFVTIILRESPLRPTRRSRQSYSASRPYPSRLHFCMSTERTPAATATRHPWAARARTLAVAYLLLLAGATHLPQVNMPPIGASDKLYHFVAYAALAVVVLAGWELTLGTLQPKHFFAVWLAGTLYGAIDEITQSPFGRVSDASDWMADCLGVVIGLVTYLAVRRLWRGAPKPLTR